MRRKRALVVKVKSYTWTIGALYKLGRDGVLRRCVVEVKSVALLKEAHADATGGHMAGEVMAKKILQVGY